METVNGHEAVIEVLRAEGVGVVFALMAEDTMHLLADLKKHYSDEITVVEARHEQGAMAMAHGYSQASGDVGVCIVGRGPGIAQTGTTLVSAHKDGSELLAIVPESATDASYDPKEFTQESFLRSTVGEVISARSTDNLVSDLQEGFRRIRAGEGPVAVQVAWNVLDGDLAIPDELGDSREVGRARPQLQPDERRIEAAVDAYLGSDATKPPVVLAGRGAIRADARAALEALAERTNAVLATTLRARGFFEDHPFSVGFVGEWGGNLANEFLTDADCVFAVGCTLNPHTTDHGYLVRDEAKVIQVDVDRGAIGRHTPVDVGIEGDARATARELLEALEREGIDREGEFWTDRLRERIETTPRFDDDEFPGQPGVMDPRETIRAVDDILPEDRLVVTDGGHFTRWVVDGLRTPDPGDLVWTLDFAAIGQGMGSGVGAAVAAGDRPCVTVCGDAGFMMAVQELETAVRLGLPMSVVVMNDGALGSEYHNLQPATDYPEAALIDTPDFASVAESMGARGFTARGTDELYGIADRIADPDHTVVVDCKINENVRHRSKG